MTDEQIAQAMHEKLVDRCRALGIDIPPISLAKQALRGQRWTPREYNELRELLEAGKTH